MVLGLRHADIHCIDSVMAAVKALMMFYIEGWIDMILSHDSRRDNSKQAIRALPWEKKFIEAWKLDTVTIEPLRTLTHRLMGCPSLHQT